MILLQDAPFRASWPMQLLPSPYRASSRTQMFRASHLSRSDGLLLHGSSRYMSSLLVAVRHVVQLMAPSN